MRHGRAIPALVIALSPVTALADDHDECVRRAHTQAEIEACPEPEKPVEVTVRAKPPPRSASDWEANEDTIRAAPHESGADVLDVAPGVFVSDRGLPGRAPHLSLRGFDGTSGQDVEIFAGNIPMNQVSHMRAPGYADMRLVMPEVVRSVRIQNGPYDPRQGDFAVAGSVRMDLGLEQPGFWVKGGLGSFGARRVFLAFAPITRSSRRRTKSRRASSRTKALSSFGWKSHSNASRALRSTRPLVSMRRVIRCSSL